MEARNEPVVKPETARRLNESTDFTMDLETSERLLSMLTGALATISANTFTMRQKVALDLFSKGLRTRSDDYLALPINVLEQMIKNCYRAADFFLSDRTSEAALDNTRKSQHDVIALDANSLGTISIRLPKDVSMIHLERTVIEPLHILFCAVDENGRRLFASDVQFGDTE